MSEFWEPWQPQIGQRVRVRLSAECPVRETQPQGAPADGRSGIVQRVTTPETALTPGHFYKVVLDEPFDGYTFGWASAIELEPLVP